MLLADNVAAFRLEVVPEGIKDINAMLASLGEVIALSDDDIARFNSARRNKKPFESVPLRLKLSEDEIAHFSVERWRFPAVDVVPYLTRTYPFGETFAHVVGYVGRIDISEAARLDADLYTGTTHIGKTGIERYYEDVLHGTPGYERVEVNADRKKIGDSLERVAPTPGKNLYLSIDARLQTSGLGLKKRSRVVRARPLRSIRAMAKCLPWSASRTSIRTCSSTASVRSTIRV